MARLDYNDLQPTVKLQTPLEIEDGFNQIQQGRNQNRLAQRQFQEADRVDAERNALAGIAQQHGNNPEAYGNALMRGGFVKQSQDFNKYQADAARAGVQLKNDQLTVEKLGFEISEKERIQGAQRIGALRGQPYGAVIEDMANGLRDAVAANKITPEDAEQKYAAMLQKIPRDQAGLDAFIDSTVKSVMSPKDLYNSGNPQGADSPSSIREWNAYNAMPPQQQEAYLRMKRADQIMNLGGSQAVRGQLGGIREQYSVTPKETDTPAYQAAQESAKLSAKANVEKRTDAEKKGRGVDSIVANIDQAEEILKRGSATGSVVGSGVAALKRGVGYSDVSTQDNNQLKLLSGWMVANVPRMEGPQSNFDVENYKQMAADVGDRSTPIGDRLAALKQLRSLQAKYKSIQGGGGSVPNDPKAASAYLSSAKDKADFTARVRALKAKGWTEQQISAANGE